MNIDSGYGTNLFDFFGILAAFGLMALFITLIILIVLIVAQYKLFKKAGYAGWEALIPFYSTWILFKIAGLNWWWFLLFFVSPLIPGIGYLAFIFITFNCYYNISKKFNKDVGFAICLTIFTPICIAILGFSNNCVYDKSVKVSNNGIFDNSKDDTDRHDDTDKNDANMCYCKYCGKNITKDIRFCPHCGKENI